MAIKINKQDIKIRGRMSNYNWIDLKVLDDTEKEKIRKKYGNEWFKEYLDALKIKKGMKEKEIAMDLIKDMQKAGWRLVRNEQIS